MWVNIKSIQIYTMQFSGKKFESPWFNYFSNDHRHVEGSMGAISEISKETTVSKFSPRALKHFHKHLKDPRCKGDLKKKLMQFAKENGIMKVLMKRGYVRSEIVAAWDMLEVAEAISWSYFWNLSLTSTFLTFVIFLT